MINKLFEGHTLNYLECINVDYKSSRKESFMDVQVGSTSSTSSSTHSSTISTAAAQQWAEGAAGSVAAAASLPLSPLPCLPLSPLPGIRPAAVVPLPAALCSWVWRTSARCNLWY